MVPETIPLNLFWRGETIPDAEHWAEQRGEQMVDFRAVMAGIDLPRGVFVFNEYESTAPASFFDAMQDSNREAGGFPAWRYTELRRRAPKLIRGVN